MLIRTQLMLDDQLKRDLLMLAAAKNQSMSQLVRMYVVENIKKEKKVLRRRKKISAAQSLLSMAKAAERIAKKYGISGPRDLAVNHDYYLYGAPKQQP